MGKQWEDQESDEVKTLSDILKWLRKLQISLSSGVSSGGWTDDGTTVKLTTSTDSVGIGTASPLTKLHVLHDTEAVAFFQSSTNSYVKIQSGNNLGAVLSLTDGTDEGTVTFDGATGTLIIDAGSDGVEIAASGVVTIPNLGGSGTGIVAVDNNGVLSFTGKTGVVREIWIDAGAMVARTTNGAASDTTETTTNDLMIDSFLFDGTTEEGVQFKLSFPQAWNAGTVKVKVYWDAATGASAAEGVVWGIKAGALANDDAIDTALGTEVEVADTVIAVGDLHITSATGAITIAGSPTVDEMIVFQIARKVGNASDTMNEDAKLLGIKVQYTETSVEPSAW